MTDPKGLPYVVEQIQLIQQSIENMQKTLRDNLNLEATAAKIITDLTVEIHNCHCKDEIAELQREVFEKLDKCECTAPLAERLEQLLKQPASEAQPEPEQPKKPPSRLKRYTFPNFEVGNPELGSSANPKPMKWPYGGSQD